jgi:hypothetical protein
MQKPNEGSKHIQDISHPNKNVNLRALLIYSPEPTIQKNTRTKIYKNLNYNQP